MSTATQDAGIGEDGLITEQAFVDTWGATVRPNGDLLEFLDVVSKPPNTVWTIVEAEDHLVAMPGFRIVNKLGYCTTTRPWTNEQLDAYWFFNDLDVEDDEDQDSDD